MSIDNPTWRSQVERGEAVIVSSFTVVKPSNTDGAGAAVPDRGAWYDSLHKNPWAEPETHGAGGSEETRGAPQIGRAHV